jgi:hypothetical protein
VGKKTITITDASAASSTTLQETGSGWIPNEFAGLIVELTGGTGSGQSRRVIGNTTDTLTVSPAFDTTPDTTTDFEVDPESLYGASDIVNAIGITAESPLGEARMMCAGTNSTSDTGGVTCYNHQAGPNVVAEVFHANAKKLDDYNDEWTGTDYDDIKSIDLSGRSLIIGSMAHMYTRTEDVRLGQGLDYLASQLFNIRGEIIQDGIILTGSLGLEIGFTGGADLAEYYKSPEPLEAGMIVATGDGGADTVKKTSGAYQKDVLGIVATAPGMILGTQEENSYPIALSGRVPVKVTTENGMILQGDQITSSSLPGYGMVAIETGRIIGTVLEDPNMETFAECPAEAGLPVGTKCGQVMAFVNLSDFTGMTIADLMTKKGYDAAAQNPQFAELLATQVKQEIEGENPQGDSVIKSEWTNIFQAANTLGFLQKLNDPSQGAALQSEILAKNINASGSVVSPLIVTDTLVAKSIKAEKIEGLEIFETGIRNAQDSADGSAAQVKSLSTQIVDLQNSLKSLSEKSGGLETAAIKDAESDGGLIVGGTAQFNGLAIFNKVAQFFDKVIFGKEVEFAGGVLFNQDTAGYALVQEGSDSVRISFEKEYAAVPVINASLSLQQIQDEEVRKAAEELLLVSDVKFIITNVTAKGFEIRTSQNALSDIPFAWQAMAVKDAKIFESANLADKADDDKTDESEPEIETVSAEVEIAPPIETVEPVEAPAAVIVPAAEASAPDENPIP